MHKTVLTDLVLNTKLEFVGYINQPGGRVWIGNICVANVFERGGKPDLFNQDPIKYKFDLGYYVKYQPENEWLKALSNNEQHQLFDTIEEGLKWIKSKLIADNKETNLDRLVLERDIYKAAYEELSCYFDSISEDEQDEVYEKLKTLFDKLPQND